MRFNLNSAEKAVYVNFKLSKPILFMNCINLYLLVFRQVQVVGKSYLQNDNFLIKSDVETVFVLLEKLTEICTS